METTDRLNALRKKMAQDGIGAVLIRSTDRYFNEYVPREKNQRAWLSGFNGSAGDALVTQEFATLFVDGRYTLQAAQQAPAFTIDVAPLGTSIQQQWLQAIGAIKDISNPILYVDTQLVSGKLLEHIENAAQRSQVKVIAHPQSYLKHIGFEGLSEGPQSELKEIDQSLSGQSVSEKHTKIKQFLIEHNLDGLLLTLLDEIAWISNLRAADFENQSTFAARALVFHDKIFIGLENFNNQKGPEGIELCPEKDLWLKLQEHSTQKKLVLGVDDTKTPQNIIAELESQAELKFLEGPIKHLKAVKNKQELLHMRDAFARADKVVNTVQKWLCAEITKGSLVTEAQVGAYLTKTFFDSGAKRLSFSPICAAGKHAAVIHYGTLDDKTPLTKGELFLLDVGGIYEGGYATDLTRTFLLGDESLVATQQQKDLFTVVLKGAIAGLSARFPKSTTGLQLDAIVRAPIWQAGYDYAHGTGHGVGINVHEAPPTIAVGSATTFAEGHVFSIEPGIYLPEFGGIRIENLATVVDDSEHPGYFRVLPLTFAPFDKRLIDDSKLTPFEKQFLAYYSEAFEWDSTQMPKLPV